MKYYACISSEAHFIYFLQDLHENLHDMQEILSKQVKIVFLISLSKQEGPDIQEFYSRLSKLLASDALLNELYEKGTYAALIDILNSLGE